MALHVHVILRMLFLLLRDWLVNLLLLCRLLHGLHLGHMLYLRYLRELCLLRCLGLGL